jgi:hypothetical protein
MPASHIALKILYPMLGGWSPSTASSSFCTGSVIRESTGRRRTTASGWKASPSRGQPDPVPARRVHGDRIFKITRQRNSGSRCGHWANDDSPSDTRHRNQRCRQLCGVVVKQGGRRLRGDDLDSLEIYLFASLLVRRPAATTPRCPPWASDRHFLSTNTKGTAWLRRDLIASTKVRAEKWALVRVKHAPKSATAVRAQLDG